MPVFPETLDRLDLGDVNSSLKRVENYIRYMTERLEFANQHWGNGGGSGASVEVIAQLNEMSSELSAMQTTISGLNRAITDMTALMTVDGDDLSFTKNLAIDCGVWAG